MNKHKTMSHTYFKANVRPEIYNILLKLRIADRVRRYSKYDTYDRRRQHIRTLNCHREPLFILFNWKNTKEGIVWWANMANKVHNEITKLINS